MVSLGKQESTDITNLQTLYSKLAMESQGSLGVGAQKERVLKM